MLPPPTVKVWMVSLSTASVIGLGIGAVWAHLDAPTASGSAATRQQEPGPATTPVAATPAGNDTTATGSTAASGVGPTHDPTPDRNSRSTTPVPRPTSSTVAPRPSDSPTTALDPTPQPSAPGTGPSSPPPSPSSTSSSPTSSSPQPSPTSTGQTDPPPTVPGT